MGRQSRAAATHCCPACPSPAHDPACRILPQLACNFGQWMYMTVARRAQHLVHPCLHGHGQGGQQDFLGRGKLWAEQPHWEGGV